MVGLNLINLWWHYHFIQRPGIELNVIASVRPLILLSNKLSDFLTQEGRARPHLFCPHYPQGVGGGGGTLIFSIYVGSGPASTVHPK